MPARKKRPPWAAMPQQERRDLRHQFSKLPLPQSALTALEFLRRGPENFSRETKIDFLKQNHSALSKATKRMGVSSRKREIVLDNIATAPNEALNEAVGITVNEIVIQHVKPFLGSRLKKHLADYFKARGMPISSRLDRKAFNMALAIGLKEIARRKNPFAIVQMGPLDFGMFEKHFVESRKQLRNEFLEWNEVTNHLFRESLQFFPGITPNQKARLKKMIFEALDPKILRNAADKFSKGEKPPLEGSPDYELMIKKSLDVQKTSILNALNEARKQFVPKIKYENTQKREPVATKAGTRQERLEAYVREEQYYMEREVAAQIEERTHEYFHSPFNRVSYALKQIEAQNPAASSELNRLVKGGQLVVKAL